MYRESWTWIEKVRLKSRIHDFRNFTRKTLFEKFRRSNLSRTSLYEDGTRNKLFEKFGRSNLSQTSVFETDREMDFSRNTVFVEKWTHFPRNSVQFNLIQLLATFGSNQSTNWQLSSLASLLSIPQKKTDTQDIPNEIVSPCSCVPFLVVDFGSASKCKGPKTQLGLDQLTRQELPNPRQWSQGMKTSSWLMYTKSLKLIYPRALIQSH